MYEWDAVVMMAATTAADIIALDASDPETAARALVAKTLNR